MKRRASYFKSLRFRILIILILMGILPSILAPHIVIRAYESRAVQIRQQDLRECLKPAAAMLIKEGYLTDPDNDQVDAELALIAVLHQGRVIVTDADFRIVNDTFGEDTGRYILSPLLIRCFRGEDAYRYDPRDRIIEAAVPVISPDVDQIQGALLITISTTGISTTMAELEKREILIIGIVGALVVLLAYFLSTILVKPFARVTRAIEDLTDGYQDEEISVKDYTETALITDAFNKMLTRMKVLDDSRNEFVSNVSHELKTPMTSMKVLADSLVGQENVPEELYQEFLQDITKEIDRENKIISDLLSLVKLDKKAADLTIEHVNVNSLVEDILKRLKPIAALRSIDLFLESFRPVEADLDVVKFASAISNLVENGIKYNVDDGWVRVKIDSDHQFLYIDVSDSGMGIPADSIGKIFERFYRVDKSHSKEIGGTGLGLAITRSAISAHRGTVTVESTEGEGTTFHVKLPLKYIPAARP